MPEPKPMLQRVRDTVGRRVNLVHRLDSGTSGILLCAFPEQSEAQAQAGLPPGACAVTSALQAALASPDSQKVYYAITRGNGASFRPMGPFLVDRAIRTEPPRRILRSARTRFTFLTGCEASRPLKDPNTDEYIPAAEFASTAAPGDWGRASLVRCELDTGRWHQIRRHLNGLSMFVLGDSQHGNSATNREWRGYGLMPERRLALHCARLWLPATDLTPEIDITCPLPTDLRALVDALPASFGKEARELAPELFQPMPKDLAGFSGGPGLAACV